MLRARASRAVSSINATLSLGAMPAVGSSISNRRGSFASAIASSTRFRSP